MGRPRKSDDEKRLTGSYRSDRDAPKPPAIQPAPFGDCTPPDCLGTVGGAKWLETIPLLLRSGVLTAADRDAVLSYCVAFDRRAECDAAIAKDGTFYGLPNGAIVAHPAINVRAKAEKQIADFQRCFGMTAAARDRMKPTKAEPRMMIQTRDRTTGKFHVTREQAEDLKGDFYLSTDPERRRLAGEILRDCNVIGTPPADPISDLADKLFNQPEN